MRRHSFAFAACAALCTAAKAGPVTYRLPEDTIPAIFSEPDAQVVVANCSGCHSLDYLTTQPPRKGAQFWRDTVNKMINVYGAPVQSSEVDGLTAVLANRLN